MTASRRTKTGPLAKLKSVPAIEQFEAAFGKLSKDDRGFWARQLKWSPMTRFRPGCPHRPKPDYRK